MWTQDEIEFFAGRLLQDAAKLALLVEQGAGLLGTVSRAILRKS